MNMQKRVKGHGRRKGEKNPEAHEAHGESRKQTEHDTPQYQSDP